MNLADVEKQLEQLQKSIDAILTALNGKEGIIVEQELLKQKMKEMPTPNEIRLYAMIGSGAIGFLAVIGYFIYAMFTGTPKAG